MLMKQLQRKEPARSAWDQEVALGEAELASGSFCQVSNFSSCAVYVLANAEFFRLSDSSASFRLFRLKIAHMHLSLIKFTNAMTNIAT